MLTPPKSLGIYVHLPWCVKKCPYCDFNSHAIRNGLPEREYLDALKRDLAMAATDLADRQVTSVYFGGGTPSLFSAGAIGEIIDALASSLTFDEPEITLEANPGTAEAQRFADFAKAGVNRLSIGVQSFDDSTLERIGRIHDGGESLAAIQYAHDAGITNFNIDLMFAQPEQTAAMALADIRTALSCEPTHLSCYQLTIEPNTLFHHDPPALPDDDSAWQMQLDIARMLELAGFSQYEVSAWSKPDRQSRHNRNYWEFGDYLGIGAGAHGKLTYPDRIVRTARRKNPERFMQAAGTPDSLDSDSEVAHDARAFEYMLNALRLNAGFDLADFESRTGLARTEIEATLGQARASGLIGQDRDRIVPSRLGRQFLNDLTGMFL